MFSLVGFFLDYFPTPLCSTNKVVLISVTQVFHRSLMAHSFRWIPPPPLCLWIFRLFRMALLKSRLTCGASCAAPGDRTSRSSDRSCGTWTAWHLCACGSGGSARRSSQTSIHSPPRSTCTAFHLQREGRAENSY